MRWLLPLALLLVAGCGADGPPHEIGAVPEGPRTRSATGADVVIGTTNRTRFSVSGETRVGVVGSL